MLAGQSKRDVQVTPSGESIPGKYVSGLVQDCDISSASTGDTTVWEFWIYHQIMKSEISVSLCSQSIC